MDINFVTHAFTVICGALAGGVVTGLGVWFWGRGKAIELRAKEAELRAKINEITAKERAISFNELKALSSWQSDQFRKRSEEVDKRLSTAVTQMDKLQAEYNQLHIEHLECETERVASAGKIIAIELELSQLRGVANNIEPLIERTITRMLAVKQLAGNGT